AWSGSRRSPRRGGCGARGGPPRAGLGAIRWASPRRAAAWLPTEPVARLPEARLAPATARFGTRSDVTVVGLAAGAAGVGLLATVAPVPALALTALLVLAALMATDPATGLCIFTGVTFLESLPGLAGPPASAGKP